MSNLDLNINHTTMKLKTLTVLLLSLFVFQGITAQKKEINIKSSDEVTNLLCQMFEISSKIDQNQILVCFIMKLTKNDQK